MKNHFMTAYFGNKRTEVETLLKFCMLEDIETIIEPFCGSCALSYYISTVYPLKYKYILNDNNAYLIDLLNICKCKDKLKLFELKINELAVQITNIEIYKKIINDTSIEGTFIKNKIYNIRPGLYKTDYKYKYINISACPIIHFLQTENIIITNICGVQCIKNNIDDKKNFIFVDPPYLQSCNDYYQNPDTNVYEYFYNNNLQLMNCKLMLCLENIWIIKLLFKNNLKHSYEKTYESSKKTTTHIIITNY